MALIGKVVDFEAASDRLVLLDFTDANTELTEDILDNTDLFTAWVAAKLALNGCRYGIGGYAEHRSIYSRSAHFDGHEEPRRLHLGVDIWGPAGTAVYNFQDAVVHSFKFNDHFGDYGATIILQYNLENSVFYALYGHLSLSSLQGLAVGQFVSAGAAFAALGRKEENGHWPPHLHFQLILDMQGFSGDYPGVCQYSKKDSYLNNCPDPMRVLKHTFPNALPLFL